MDYVIYPHSVSVSEVIKLYQISEEDLIEYNDLKYKTTIPGKVKIFLTSKRNKSSSGEKYHEVKDGETIWEIAQKYGINLESLLKRNWLKQGDEPLKGERIQLKGKAPYAPKISKTKPNLTKYRYDKPVIPKVPYASREYKNEERDMTGELN